MPKNREKQRVHLRCGMTKEERLREECLRKERIRMGVPGGLGNGLDRKNYYGLSDPTPYKAVRNMIRRGERL